MTILADLAIIGANIRTLDPDRPHATALAVRDGVIIAVGDDGSVRDACDASTRIVDGSGLTVTPGLVDAHMHPFLGAVETAGADLMGTETVEDVLSALGAEAARREPGAWIQGWGMRYDLFQALGGDNRRIAEAVGDRPAVIRFYDGHTAVVTPAALALAGIDGPRAFTEDAEIVCRDGVPTGELREAAAMHIVEAVRPVMPESERVELILAHFGRMHAVGLTGAHAMIGDRALLDLVERLELEERLAVRLVIPLHQSPDVSDDEVALDLEQRDRGGRLWRGGVAKFFADGVIESGTAWMIDPWPDGSGSRCFWPSEARYAEVVRRFAQTGFQCVTHACGDGAVRGALDAYRAAGAAPGVRHRIEHIETLTGAELSRFAREGVVASVQPLHHAGIVPDRADPWSAMAGPVRVAHAWPYGSILASGAIVALGSDWPVANFDPRLGMAVAQLRREPGKTDQTPLGRDEALTAGEALAGYTLGVAQAVSEEGHAGRVRPGYRADLTCFGGDPVTTAADDLPGLPIAATIVDGNVVFEA